MVMHPVVIIDFASLQGAEGRRALGEFSPHEARQDLPSNKHLEVLCSGKVHSASLVKGGQHLPDDVRRTCARLLVTHAPRNRLAIGRRRRHPFRQTSPRAALPARRLEPEGRGGAVHAGGADELLGGGPGRGLGERLREHALPRSLVLRRRFLLHRRVSNVVGSSTWGCGKPGLTRPAHRRESVSSFYHTTAHLAPTSSPRESTKVVKPPPCRSNDRTIPRSSNPPGVALPSVPHRSPSSLLSLPSLLSVTVPPSSQLSPLFLPLSYGDISPSTPLSRIVITGLILTLFFCAPVVTNAIYDVARLRPKHGGRLSKSRGTGHVVVSVLRLSGVDRR